MNHPITMPKIHRITIYITLCLFIFAVCIFTPSRTDALQCVSSQQRCASHLTHITPAELDNEPVYPSRLVTPPLEPLQYTKWQTITLPTEWINQGYYYELWDGANLPINGFQAKKLTESTIDISDIDASLYPALRVVIFQPSTSPSLLYAKPITVEYGSALNLRLIIFGVAATILYGIIGWLAWRRKPYIRDAVVTIVASNIFALSLAMHAGKLQFLYVLIKFPFLLLVAWGISVASLVVITNLTRPARAAPNDLRDNTRQDSLSGLAKMSLRLIAITAMGLASVSTILATFQLLDLGHDKILSLTILLFVAVGTFAANTLWLWLRPLYHNTNIVPALITLLWLAIYGMTFLQLGWQLRPWVGTLDPIHNSVPFMRTQAGNVFLEAGRTIERSL